MPISAKIQRWNPSKPHRCPQCHAVTVDLPLPLRSIWVYRCCTCSARFTRWPRLSWVLPRIGSRCSYHQPRVR